MKTNNPLVSVCIPVYNGQYFIREAIDSVLNQTYKNFELLIADNASIDETINIIKNYNDTRIKLICNKTNVGMINNWNVLLNECSGEWIHFLCADDILETNCLEEQISHIKQSNDNLVLLTNPTLIINKDNKVLFKRRHFYKTCNLIGKKIAKKAFIKGNLFGEPSNVLFKKNVLINSGLFDNEVVYSADLDLWIKIACMGYVGHINKFLTRYRVSQYSETNNLKTKLSLDNKKITSNVLKNKYLRINKLDIFFRNVFVRIRNYKRKIFLKFIK